MDWIHWWSMWKFLYFFEFNPLPPIIGYTIASNFQDSGKGFFFLTMWRTWHI